MTTMKTMRPPRAAASQAAPKGATAKSKTDGGKRPAGPSRNNLSAGRAPATAEKSPSNKE